MSEVELMLVATEAKSACEGVDGLREKFVAAMKAAHNHYMVLDEDKQFRGAVAGVMLSVGEGPERDRIATEMKSIQAVNALLQGLPIDISRVEIAEDPIGIIGIWKETA